MDYEVVSQMQVDGWKEKINSSINMILDKIVKKTYPFVIDVADIEFVETSIITKQLELKITLYVNDYPSQKEQMKLNKDFETLLDMMGLSKLDTSDGEVWKLNLTTQLVLNN